MFNNKKNKEKEQHLTVEEKDVSDATGSEEAQEITGSDIGKEVALRNAFYKDSYLKSLGIIVFTFLSFALSVYFAAYLYTYTPAIKYIPVDAGGKVLKETSVSQPIMPEEELKQWTFDALKDIFSYHYYGVDTHGAKIRHYFSAKSYQEFMNSFENSSDLKRVERNFFIVDVEPSIPELENEGQLNNGTRFWRYSIKLRKLFVNHQGFIKDDDNLIVNVVRSNSPEAKDGILIYNIREQSVTGE